MPQKKYVYKNAHRLKEIRQSLRVIAPIAEKILWRYLRNNQLGYKFRRQFSMGSMVVDFCSEQLKLAIEVDGWTHDYEKTRAKDLNKQKFLEANGYKVIRLKNEQIFGDIEKVLDKIKRTCSVLVSFPF